MIRIAIPLALVAVALVVTLSVSPSSDPVAAAAEESKLAVVDIMVVANAGPNSLFGQLKGMLKGDGPADEKAWKQVKARTQVLATLAGLMKKSKPKKGDAASWKEQTEGYEAALKKLAAAAAAANAAGTAEEAKLVGRTCGGCHKPHK